MGDVLKFTILADDKASGQFRKLSSAIKGGVTIVTKLAKAVAATATAFIAFNVANASVIDTQAKFAVRINKSVTELTKYQFVARQSGLTTQNFNLSMQRMTRRVGEASKGLGEARGALNDLGIDATKFKNLGLEDQILTLSDRFGDLSDDSDELRLAFKLFDSEGTAVLQMLKNNRKELKAAADDAEFLGTAIGPGAAKQAELFSDKMGRATSAMKGLSFAISGETMPILAGLADRFANLVGENRGDIANFVRDTISGVTIMGQLIAQVFDEIYRIFTDRQAFKNFVAAVVDLAPAVGKAAIGLGSVLVDSIQGAVTVMIETFVNFGSWAKEHLPKIFSGGLEEAWDGMLDVITDGWKEMFATITGNAAEIKNVYDGLSPELESFSDNFSVSMGKAKQAADDLIAGISLFAPAVEENNDKAIENTNLLVESLKSKYAEFKDWLHQANSQFAETMFSTIQSGIETVSQGLAAAIVSGQSLMDALENTAKQVVTSMIGALIKLGIQRMLVSSIIGGAAKSEAMIEGSKAVALAGTNMFASWAAAPWPISMGAPAAAAAAITGAAAAFSTGAATGSALGATIGAVAHGGMTNNPEERTFTIHRNERILSPRQNRDLTSALAQGRVGGGGVSVGQMVISVLPNATNLDALNGMNPRDLADVIEDAVLMALNNMDRKGVQPNFAERVA